MVVVIKRNPKKVDSLILIERTALKEGPQVRAVRCSRDLPVMISVVFIIQGVGEVVCQTRPPPLRLYVARAAKLAAIA